MYCVNHPDTETYLRCNRCGKPICIRCAVRTPVGYRCKDCLRNQQQAHFQPAKSGRFAAAGTIASLLAIVTGWLVPNLGWPTLILAPIAGLLVVNVMLRILGSKRTESVGKVIYPAIVIGVVPGMALMLADFLLDPASKPTILFYLTRGVAVLPWVFVYLLEAVGIAYFFLRNKQ